MWARISKCGYGAPAKGWRGAFYSCIELRMLAYQLFVYRLQQRAIISYSSHIDCAVDLYAICWAQQGKSRHRQERAVSYDC